MTMPRLIYCRCCHKAVSSEATTCPHCGDPDPYGSSYTATLTFPERSALHDSSRLVHFAWFCRAFDETGEFSFSTLLWADLPQAKKTILASVARGNDHVRAATQWSNWTHTFTVVLSQGEVDILTQCAQRNHSGQCLKFERQK
jgi:hypothetical protein